MYLQHSLVPRLHPQEMKNGWSLGTRLLSTWRYIVLLVVCMNMWLFYRIDFIIYECVIINNMFVLLYTCIIDCTSVVMMAVMRNMADYLNKQAYSNPGGPTNTNTTLADYSRYTSLFLSARAYDLGKIRSQK